MDAESETGPAQEHEQLQGVDNERQLENGEDEGRVEDGDNDERQAENGGDDGGRVEAYQVSSKSKEKQAAQSGIKRKSIQVLLAAHIFKLPYNLG